MISKENNAENFKQKVAHELRQLLINFIFMALIFTALTMYKQILLNEVKIGYFHYGYALFEALILAKIVTLGQSFHFGEKFENQKLIYSTLYKTFIFSLFVLFFTILEHVIESIFHHKGLMEIVNIIKEADWNLILAKTFLMFIIFIPFFSLLETGRVLKEGKLLEMFFQNRSK